MEKFTVGDIVVVLYPFSDLKGHKIRPAMVSAKAEFNNLILCQITSKSYSSKIAIKLIQADFVEGKLPVISYLRPDKLFTADISIIQRKIGRLTIMKKNNIISKIRGRFKTSNLN